ncbi:MAG: hypothetical protein AAFR16_09410 [Pseudomonadota bacterium]
MADAPARILVCDGVERWVARREGEAVASGAEPRRWRVRLFADGRAETAGHAGRWVGTHARLHGSRPAPAGAASLEVLANDIVVDLETMRLSGERRLRYLRTPYDHATVAHETERVATGRCFWSG